MTAYYEKLRSPTWQKKRLEILNERGFSCEVCCCEDEQLHVHHKIYKKGLDPWDYPDYNYSVLCESCHKYAHETIDMMNDLVGVLPVDGHFSQHGVLSFLLNFLDEDDEWIRATDKQFKYFHNINPSDDFNGSILMSNIGRLANTLIPTNRKKIEFNSKFENDNLSNEQLADIFTAIALNHSNIHPDEINAVRASLGLDGV